MHMCRCVCGHGFEGQRATSVARPCHALFAAVCDKQPTLELPGVLLSLLRTSPRHTGMTDIATASFMWQQASYHRAPLPHLLWQLTIST